MRLTRSVFLPSLGLAAAALLCGCEVGRGPVVQIQTCVENESGISDLRKILRRSALDAGLEFTDYSSKRPAELKAAGVSLAFLRKPEDYFEVSANNGAGAGFAAGNLGLSSFEVSIGFNGGDKAGIEAKALAARVVPEISKRWPVLIVPADRGALPTGQCPSK
ncbi:MAG: hypothetical protein QM719_05870 [Thermomonas sp.]